MAGLYGHPQYAGVCVACSVLLSTRAAPIPALPANAVWDDSLGWCNASAWTCKQGFVTRVWAGQKACCPAAVPHSGTNSNTPRAPCGVACDSGYYWNAAAYTCSACAGTLSVGFTWGDNCSSFFGCGRYAVQLNLAVPANAYWPATATGPQQCRWMCNAGYVQNGGLCCAADTVGYGSVGREWFPGICATRCGVGLFAAELGGQCVQCSQYLATLGIDYCQRYDSILGTLLFVGILRDITRIPVFDMYLLPLLLDLCAHLSLLLLPQ